MADWNGHDLTKPSGIFIAMFLFGITIAIFIQTGVNINPEDLLIDVGDIIIEQTGGELSFYWTVLKICIGIIGIFSLIGAVYLIYSQGISSIFIAVSGFISGITILFKPVLYVGIFFLIIGGLLVRFLES